MSTRWKDAAHLYSQMSNHRFPLPIVDVDMLLKRQASVLFDSFTKCPSEAADALMYQSMNFIRSLPTQLNGTSIPRSNFHVCPCMNKRGCKSLRLHSAALLNTSWGLRDFGKFSKPCRYFTRHFGLSVSHFRCAGICRYVQAPQNAVEGAAKPLNMKLGERSVTDASFCCISPAILVCAIQAILRTLVQHSKGCWLSLLYKNLQFIA